MSVQPQATVGEGGSEHAYFRALYEAELDYVWRTLRRLGARERDVEDLAHDVFVAAWRALERYDRDRPVRPWLFGIAFRVVSDYRRRARFSREIPTERHTTRSEGPDPLENAAAAQDRALVLAALDALPPPQRAVFVLSAIDGHTVPEIAAGLGVSDNTCYSRLRLARKRFADAVRRLRPAPEKP
ncbi:MAG: sigma-70 family RNA polymerase sigma factor [Deltaproteobacteria bacterium]|nr:sigma-70 family RNA polymerase sigma factor [Deltaproteobacteria bacterium]MCB9788832.1 sigma-70 family RNA polymerase sigma factor [Deltaproteobacteria bacterium]